MEAKHTPGPWFVSKSPLANGLAEIERGTHEDNHIAECEWNNAPLIAASPEMFEALKSIAALPLGHHEQKKIAKAAVALVMGGNEA